MLDRYDYTVYDSDQYAPATVEWGVDPLGDWVRWSDVELLLKKITELQQSYHEEAASHERDGDAQMALLCDAVACDFGDLRKDIEG